LSSAPEEILSEAKEARRTILLETEAEEICAHYGISVAESRLATTKEEASEIVEKLRYPVALKIISPAIPHKTEAGGVLVGVQNQDELTKGFEKILANARNYAPHARIIGILVQRVVQPGIEVMIGGLRDQQFGPTVMFGVGGIFTEVFKDAIFALVPIDESEAYRMIRSIEAYPILTGYRNMARVNEKSIVDIIVRTSKLLSDHPQIEQMDLNPTIVNDKVSIVVDARILLRA
jgi:acyl-CoA synthetase (NDP forming)